MKSDWDLKLNRKTLDRDVVAYYSADLSFSLKNRIKTRVWLYNLSRSHGFVLKSVSYVFCSDEYLLEINRSFLQHDDYTDIITFDLSEKKGELCGEIYISIPRVKENARTFGVSFYDELHRVMAHGILHLCGFKDKTKQQAQSMRKAENEALLMRNF